MQNGISIYISEYKFEYYQAHNVLVRDKIITI